jgi:hypothetical protein
MKQCVVRLCDNLHDARLEHVILIKKQFEYNLEFSMYITRD